MVLFIKNVERGGDVGFLNGGTAWYRKHFNVEEADAGRQFILHFDGIQSEAILFINGKKVYEHNYGYTPFNVNITPYLNKSKFDNIITVKVMNPGLNSRWYPGFGIYRDVMLSILNPIHIESRNVFITTPKVTKDEATINIDVEIANTLSKNETVKLLTEIISPSGNIVSQIEKEITIQLHNSNKTKVKELIKYPELWDTETPNLYHARLKLLKKGKQIDEYNLDFGIRSIEFSAESGFRLNGKKVLLKGACLHHDNGLLGAAAFKDAEFRRVEIMKKNGFNSIRTSHNPPSKHFLDACDKIGMLVINEAFDQWELPKRKNDYSQHFKAHWEKDIEAMLYRDRNHPSIIMWSFGNEIQERARPRGIEIAKILGDKIRSIDSTRPSTQAVCHFWDNKDQNWDKHTPATFAVTEIAGYNYMPHKYESDHELYPDRIIYCSESLPKNIFTNWKKVKELPYVIGDFVWTGMDYIGEAGIGISKFVEKQENLWHPQPWPWFNAYCGDIDLIGNKKPQSYYRDVVWDESDLEILVRKPVPAGKREQTHLWGWPQEEPHWSWHGFEDDTLSVNIYSLQPLVKLYLNDELIGEKEINIEEGIVASFNVPYKPGELKAVGIEKDKDEKVKILRTSGEVKRIKLIADKERIKAGADELIFVDVSLVDKNSHFIPTAEVSMDVEVKGEGYLLAAGSSKPLIEGSFQDNEFRLFKGQGLIVVRSTGQTGKILITVRSENGLEEKVHLNVVE